MNRKIKQLIIIVVITLIFLGCLIAFMILPSDVNSKEDVIENEEKTSYKQFDNSKFVDNDGLLFYEDEKYISSLGVDLSEHNGIVDFQKLKDSGVEFVIIRIGRRGYRTAKISPDFYFWENFNKAISYGLKVGVYFFSQATSTNEAIEEAQYVLDTLKGCSLDLGVAYDFERIENDEALTDSLNKEQITKNALAFFETIGDTFETMLYVNSDSLMTDFDIVELREYPIWYAQYYSFPQCPYTIKAWQYSEEGKIPGIDKTFDMNLLFTQID